MGAIMRRLRRNLVITTLLCLATPAGGGIGCSTAATPPVVEAEILELDRRYSRLIFEGELDELAAMLAPGYVHVHSSSGDVETRDSYLEFLRTRFQAKDAPPELSDVRVVVYGDHTAVVVGRSHARVEVDGRPIELDHRFLRTYVRVAGEWRLASNQSSRIK